MNISSSNRTLLSMLLLLLLLLGIGCAKKKTANPVEAEAGVPIVVPPVTLSESMIEETDSSVERDLAQQPQRPPRGAEFEATGVLKDVFFDYDRYELKPEARRALEENAAWLKRNPEVQILIEGHCDERGTIEYNEALGEKRAMSTKSYLVSLGVDPKRIFTISYGELKPFDPGHNEEAWAKNRRAHFKISSERVTRGPTN